MGGRLQTSEMPERTIQVTSETITVWASIEAVGKVRKQVLAAALDALLRAELVKYVRVTVGSLMLDHQGSGLQNIESICFELIRAKYSGTGDIERGWSVKMRNRSPVTTMIGRMQVPKKNIAKLISADDRLAEARPWVLEGLFKAQ
jgi:hypothetical protein